MDINTERNKHLRHNRHMMQSIDSSTSSFHSNGTDDNNYDDDIMISFTKNSIYSYSTDPKFNKYIGKHKYYVFLLLRIFNPFKKIILIESTLTNILNVFILKKEEQHKQNSIFIFYNHNSNLVTKIKYIGIFCLDDGENKHNQFIYTDNEQLLNVNHSHSNTKTLS